MDRNNKIESVLYALSGKHLTATEVNLNIEVTFLLSKPHGII